MNWLKSGTAQHKSRRLCTLKSEAYILNPKRLSELNVSGFFFLSPLFRLPEGVRKASMAEAW